MDREALRDAAIRYGFLFLISVVLVAGFWFHAEFYQLGLVPLLLIGGFVTFLVILAVRALGPGGLRRRARGTVPFPRDGVERMMTGTQTVAILTAGAEVPRAGSAAHAVVAATGARIGVVRIRDVRRRLLGDLREEDAAAAGYDDLEAFRSAWSRGKSWDPREIVTLVEFRREANA